jgi:hypothetical protein
VIEAPDTTGQVRSLSDFPAPITIVFHEGQKDRDLNEPAKEALQTDSRVGQGGELLHHVDYFGIASYRDIWAPNWLTHRFLARKARKFGVTILQDMDRCFSGEGDSAECPGGSRAPYFHRGEVSIAILYQRRLAHRITGRAEPSEIVPYVTALAEAAEEDRDFCWVREHVAYPSSK